MKVMLDLETLSSNNNAAVVAIGAVGFTKTGLTDARFYTAITMNSLEKSGLHISAPTFAWWCKQSDAARALFSDESAVSLTEGLKNFATWCRDLQGGLTEMWGNGADFDCVVLGNAYDAMDIYCPWRYSQNRCFRTLRSLVPGDTLNALWEKWAIGTHHNALDDAVRQANIAVEILNMLEKK